MQLPEIVAAGIFDSQIVAKNVSVSKKRDTSLFEIELPLEKGGISYIDSGARAIVPGVIICAKPGQLRHTKFPYKCYYVHMIVREGVLHDVLMGAPDYLETDKYAVYENLFSRLSHHYHALSESEEILLQSLVLELIYTIGKDAARQHITRNGANHALLIENTVRYIKEHLTENLSLDQVAKEMSLSPVYFHNTFKAAVGKTLRDYVEEQRIKKAINLLRTTDYSLTKIAYECGFSSQSYFSYVFKRRMKRSPRAYVQDIYNKYEI